MLANSPRSLVLDYFHLFFSTNCRSFFHHFNFFRCFLLSRSPARGIVPEIKLSHPFRGELVKPITKFELQLDEVGELTAYILCITIYRYRLSCELRARVPIAFSRHRVLRITINIVCSERERLRLDFTHTFLKNIYVHTFISELRLRSIHDVSETLKPSYTPALQGICVSGYLLTNYHPFPLRVAQEEER